MSVALLHRRGRRSPAPALGGTTDPTRRPRTGRARRLRVAVAAPTNEQAFGLVRTIAMLHCGSGSQTVTFVPTRSVSLPDAIRRLPGVQEREASAASRENLSNTTVPLVSTNRRYNCLGAAFSKPRSRHPGQRQQPLASTVINVSRSMFRRTSLARQSRWKKLEAAANEKHQAMISRIGWP
jgi:hypothetical protein